MSVAAVSWRAKAPAPWCSESLEHALARGAKPLAEITGFGSTGVPAI